MYGWICKIEQKVTFFKQLEQRNVDEDWIAPLNLAEQRSTSLEFNIIWQWFDWLFFKTEIIDKISEQPGLLLKSKNNKSIFTLPIAKLYVNPIN